MRVMHITIFDEPVFEFFKEFYIFLIRFVFITKQNMGVFIFPMRWATEIGKNAPMFGSF